jgi:hypothetical protein
MSRGHGYVQRKVLELIAANPNGAWTIADLCWIIYRRITKAHRVAVGRALRRMTLPGTWAIKQYWGDRKHWLCDPCNLESMKIACRGHPTNFQPGGQVYENVERAKRWRDASPIERIDIQIESLQQQSRLVVMGRGDRSFVRQCADRTVQLLAERKRLLAKAAQRGNAA